MHAPDDEFIVECSGLAKRYGDVVAVDDANLAVRSGEVLALLGPSGCGKTTTLRLIAGFERPDRGTVHLAGDVVAGGDTFVPAERRRVGVVFQEFALFPHLSVRANIGYGVRDRSERASRVDEMLDLVGLAGLGARKPHELSGGQQQRIALARALAPRPALVLLDEPFSNLDAALRAQVRGEVRAILHDAGATAVVVTHDQEEALSLADRVAVMRSGRILQVDTPHAVYDTPTDLFVATFVGDAAVLPGRVNGRGDRIDTAIGALTLGRSLPTGAYDVVLRPETVRVTSGHGGTGGDGGDGVVHEVSFFGHDQLVTVVLPDGHVLRARLGTDQQVTQGERVAVDVVGPVLAFPTAAADTTSASAPLVAP
jgi:iron(III) transport system ATP-binding protein